MNVFRLLVFAAGWPQLTILSYYRRASSTNLLTYLTVRYHNSSKPHRMISAQPRHNSSTPGLSLASSFAPIQQQPLDLMCPCQRWNLVMYPSTRCECLPLTSTWVILNLFGPIAWHVRQTGYFAGPKRPCRCKIVNTLLTRRNVLW